MNTKKTGNYGEKLAADFLVQKNYQLLEKNYKFLKKEIDIIAQKDNLLIFVEVKFRKNTKFGNPEESVNFKKQKNIKKVAENYIFLKNWQQNIRFDIIAITYKNKIIEIQHFEDAFY